MATVSARSWRLIWWVAPVVVIVIIRVLLALVSRQMDWWVILLDAVWLAAGWLVGVFLANAGRMTYLWSGETDAAYEQAKAELWVGKWRQAWSTMAVAERKGRSPVENILTLAVMVGVGVWLVSSSVSLLGAGIIWGFGMVLYSKLIGSGDYKSWYWVFARRFSIQEHQIISVLLALGLIAQMIILVRR